MDAEIDFHPQPCLIWFLLFIPNVTCTFLSDAIVKDISYTDIVTVLKTLSDAIVKDISYTGIVTILKALSDAIVKDISYSHCDNPEGTV